MLVSARAKAILSERQGCISKKLLQQVSKVPVSHDTSMSGHYFEHSVAKFRSGSVVRSRIFII